ncbi:MAG TPA: GNAT family N-acetyltransferase [Oceanospirillales bacterium]|nr:GNAT family N-acetyltransferase [Oceanospirillales bacterium]
MNKHRIRFVEKKDLNDLVRLCELHAHFERCSYDSAHKKQQLNQHLFNDNPSLWCLLAEINAEIVGYATFIPQFSTWDAEFYIYMDCLYLVEQARGYGIGEQLIDRIKQEAQKMGCSLIQWQTPEFNQRAIKFYDRIGAISKAKQRYFLDI